MLKDFQLESDSELRVPAMCDSCGDKIRLMGRKVCHTCHHHFCSSCVTLKAPSKYNTCKPCILLELDVIEQSHLTNLSLTDLKYFARRRRLVVPINVNPEQIIAIILGRQAKDLSLRARKALSQVAGLTDGANFETIDLSTLEPHVSIYSSVGQNEASMDRLSPHNSVCVDSSVEGGNKHACSSDTAMSESKEDSTRKKRPREMNMDIDYSLVNSLDSLTHESQISELSVKQLKIILQKNCINYKGCVEKHELLERVVRLWQAKEEEKVKTATYALMGDIDAEVAYLCKICMDAPVDCVLLECGHMLTCVKCGRQLAECPVCRQYVTRVVHAFRV